MAALEVSDLGFSYPGAQEPTLGSVNLSVAAEGSLALLGSSGAGKTTLLNLLSGLLPAQRGSIRLNGEEVSHLGPAERGVSQVFQFPVLYESLSVLENIAFALRTRGVAARQRRARAQALAELFDLEGVAQHKPAALNLFQKQLVGMARALVRDDIALVLLDEPLTAVEPAIKWRMRQSIKSAQQELGVTMVYVTHDQTEALTFADTVSVLHGGNVLQTASPRELYLQPDHREVARFIGNPGMNLLPVHCLSQSDRAALGTESGEIGFRPDWARVVAAGEPIPTGRIDDGRGIIELPGRVLRKRLTGASGDEHRGITTVSLEGALVEPGAPVPLVDVAGALEAGVAVGDAVVVVVDKHLRFGADGWCRSGDSGDA